MSPSYESLRAELDEIVERYRAYLARDGSKVTLTREEAVKRIRQLGFTEGDAMRWLDQKPTAPIKERPAFSGGVGRSHRPPEEMAA